MTVEQISVFVQNKTGQLGDVTRVLEAAGFRVGILAQPDWRTADDFRRFGKPRLGFLVTAGTA